MCLKVSLPDPVNAPVRICAGAISDDRPYRDTWFFVQLVGQPDGMRGRLKFVLWRKAAIRRPPAGKAQ